MTKRLEGAGPRITERVAQADDVLRNVDSAVSDLLASPEDIVEQLAPSVIPLLEADDDEMIVEAALGRLAAHPVPDVRAGTVAVATHWLPSTSARDIIHALAIDPDDLVCLPAIRVCGVERMSDLGSYVLKIIGRPSAAEHSSVSPVGRGASYGVEAVKKLLDVRGGRDLEMAEADFDRHGATPERLDWAPQSATALVQDLVLEDSPDMVRVPGGWLTHGLKPQQVPDRTFDWSRSVGARSLWLPPFLIDKYPVTNAVYDLFCDEVESAEHVWCHPLEPVSKRHWRNTLRDRRVGADHPATGIDWYDAYSHARWAGKVLPTEFQWERAARGPHSWVWPWGDEWIPDACTWFGSVFIEATGSMPSLADWRTSLARTSRSYPSSTTSPVDQHDKHTSGYGMADASGNCWEWTRSELATAGPYSPAAAARTGKPTSVVLKGGAWSSLPGQLFPSFRGQDAATCRHDEIGFRCVRQPSYAKMRNLHPGPILGTALY